MNDKRYGKIEFIWIYSHTWRLFSDEYLLSEKSGDITFFSDTRSGSIQINIDETYPNSIELANYAFSDHSAKNSMNIGGSTSNESGRISSSLD